MISVANGERHRVPVPDRRAETTVRQIGRGIYLLPCCRYLWDTAAIARVLEAAPHLTRDGAAALLGELVAAAMRAEQS